MVASRRSHHMKGRYFKNTSPVPQPLNQDFTYGDGFSVIVQLVDCKLKGQSGALHTYIYLSFYS